MSVVVGLCALPIAVLGYEVAGVTGTALAEGAWLFGLISAAVVVHRTTR